MIRIMFVCHGNICRSPMAEFIFKKLVCEKGMEGNFIISSSATSYEEIGNPIYPAAARELNKNSVGFDGHTATKLMPSDYDKYDLFLGMDDNNIQNMRSLFGSDRENKIMKLTDFSANLENISDPWYHGDFSGCFADIYDCCESLLQYCFDQKCKSRGKRK